MSHRFRRAGVVSLIVACAAVIGPVAAAQASNATILATVKNDLPKITRSQAKILDGLATYQKTHSASAVVKAIHSQNRDLTALRTKVFGQSPSSAGGAKGRADIITGLKLIVASNNLLAQELQKAAAGEPISKSQLQAAVAADKKGNIDLNAGAKLLSTRNTAPNFTG